MKKIISSFAIALGLAVAANAGTTTYTQDHTVIPAIGQNGNGFYLGLQGGVNAFQEEGPGGVHSQVGGVGGLKAGYVIGTELVRPTIEADLFYNGFDQQIPGVDLHVDSGAFLANFLVRFDLGRFQPYIGGGVGGYYAEGTLDGSAAASIVAAPTNIVTPTSSVPVSPGNQTITRPGIGKGLAVKDNTSGFAWQAVVGADFYFTPTVSLFTEYKFLNYGDTGLVSGDLQQQLVVIGARLHF